MRLLNTLFAAMFAVSMMLIGTGTADAGTPPAKGTAGKEAPAVVVRMTDNLKFVPAKVTIEAGQTVEWENTSLLVHTVTANPALVSNAQDVSLPAGAKPFDSGRVFPEKTFTHTFTVPGTYKYCCVPHEENGMIGEVVVTPAGKTAKPSAAMMFSAKLSGSDESPPVETKARGEATFEVRKDGKELHYTLTVENLEGVTMAHLHMAPKGKNGPIVVWLYPSTGKPKPIEGAFSGKLAEGTITASRLQGPLKDKTLNDLIDRMKAGDIYVQVHTKKNPEGELRGQVH
jgi:plastocyanin